MPADAGAGRSNRRYDTRCTHPKMVRRYAHPAADHLAPYAERLCALRDVNAEIHGTFWAQSEKQ